MAMTKAELVKAIAKQGRIMQPVAKEMIDFIRETIVANYLLSISRGQGIYI